jgi:endoglucanase
LRIENLLTKIAMKYLVLKAVTLVTAVGCTIVYLLRRWEGDEIVDTFVPPPATTHFPDYIKTKTYFPPFHTQGRNIIDAEDQVVKLASVNWYGASDELFIPGGLDVQHRDDIVKAIRRMGFNSVRLPYSDEMVVSNPLIPSDLLVANQDLIGLDALAIYAAVVTSLTDAGIFVIPNNHITHATWCCGINPCDSGWRNDYLGPVCRVAQTEEQWANNWVTVMAPYVENPWVIGADLRNEPRGVWGTMRWATWAAAAEYAGNRLLQLNKDWLIIVEGTSSSNDLASVATRPVILEIPSRVVYSSHVYSWSGWGSLGGMYGKRTYESFVESMQENWAYLLDEELAPVWVGEFGAPHQMSKNDKNYWDHLLKFLKSVDADFAYWAINPRKPHDNEEETYGLLEDDWKTPIWDYRTKDIVELIIGPVDP